MAQFKDGKLIVRKSSIVIKKQEFNCYTGDEIDPITGDYIDYFSGRGLAKSANNGQDTVRLNRMSKALKSHLGKDLTVREGIYKMDSGGETELDLWMPKFCSRYYGFYSRYSKKEIVWSQCLNILEGLAEANLKIMFNDAFGRTYKTGDAQKFANLSWDDARNSSAMYVEPLANAIELWVFKQNQKAWEKSENRIVKLINVVDITKTFFNTMNFELFGLNTRNIKIILGIKKEDNVAIRNYFGALALERIGITEKGCLDLILEGVNPAEAVKIVINENNFEKMDFNY